MKRKRLYVSILLLACIFLGSSVIFFIYNEIQLYKVKPSYIAHGGGEINGQRYTNSLEAVEHSIACGIKYIELDLSLTSDNKLVCVHDWAVFNEETTGVKSYEVPTYDEFRKRRFIQGGYRPMTIDDIDSIWSSNNDLFLVTDKISNPAIIDKNFSKIKDHLLIECFNFDDYKALKQKGYYKPMVSGCYNIKDWIKVVGKSMIKGEICFPTFFCSHNTYFEKNQKEKGLLEKPTRFGHALYTCPNRQSADSIFRKYSNVKLIYIDNVEK